jgi:pimeloyl-ACP methyl ester carboxylesterase
MSGMIMLKSLSKNIRYIPTELALLPWNLSAPHSELSWNSYASGKGALNTVKHCFVPVKVRRANIRHGFALPETHKPIKDSQSWFFVNGLSASKELLQLNGEALADLFNRKINLLFNASEGLVKDIAECYSGELGDGSLQSASALCKLLEAELRNRQKVVLIAHSQGGAIAMYAAKKLHDRLKKVEGGSEMLSKLEVYTFGYASIEKSLKGSIHIESFVNEFDLMSKLASNTKCADGDSSTQYIRDEGRGHLLNAHYLPAFKAGKFHTKQGVGSRLARYLSFAK